MHDIVGIGASVYDVLMTVGHFPEEDTKLMAQRALSQGGGPCSTALVAASVLGMRTAYIGTMGDDAAGDYMLKEMTGYGVDTANVRVLPGHASWTSFILLSQESGTRTCIFSKGDVPSPVLDERDLKAIREARLLHLDGNHLDAAVQGAMVARSAGVKVSLDAGSVYPGIERLFPYVDFLIAAEDFVRNATGIRDIEKAAAMLYAQYRPEVFVVTQGARGGFVYDGTACRYPVFPVDVIDSNGAGDAFHGAFLSAYLRRQDVREAARFASAFSALKCTRLGARKSMPAWDRTEYFIRMKKGGEVYGV